VGLLLSIWIWCFGLALTHKRYTIAVGLTVVLAIIVLLLPAMGTARPAMRRNQCMNQMMQITLAILEYESAYGHLPPPYSIDEKGNPLHSWRVLILPYLEEHDLYEAIDLTKPWHHPNNLALQSRMPSVYQCPSYEPDANGFDATTAYVAVIGEHTAWPRSGTARTFDITDGPSKTLALLESEKHRIHWMSTADPGIEMVGPLNVNRDTLLSTSNHNGGVVFSRWNGSVGFLASDFDFRDLLALITVDGGDSRKELP
jgi:hypothetical protein